MYTQICYISNYCVHNISAITDNLYKISYHKKITAYDIYSITLYTVYVNLSYYSCHA